MKRARAKIDIELVREMLKMPYGIELVSASYEAESDHLDVVLQGDALPIKDGAGVGKGRIPEIF